MSITEAITAVPTGRWKADPIHSSLGFAVRHMGVTPFRGGFTDFQAALVEGRLSGTARVSSISTEDETLTGHLLSPDFFDAERHPELRFDSTEIGRDGDDVSILGDLTLKGTTQPVELHGKIAGPITDPYGGSRIGLTLKGTIDRTEFGIDWNSELPSGGNLLGDEVELTAELELAQES